MYTQWPSLWSHCFTKSLFVTLQKGKLSLPTKQLKRTVATSKCPPDGSIKRVRSHHEEGGHVTWVGSKYWSYCALCMISSRESHLSFSLKKDPLWASSHGPLQLPSTLTLHRLWTDVCLSQKFITDHFSPEVSWGLGWSDQPRPNKKISVSGHKARQRHEGPSL